SYEIRFFWLVVRVPVLSKTTISTFAICSITEASFKYNFSLPKMRKRFPKVKGAAKAMAHGQATINTEVNTLNAFEGSKTNQKIVAIKAMERRVTVNRLLILSVMDSKIPAFSLLKISLPHNCVK